LADALHHIAACSVGKLAHDVQAVAKARTGKVQLFASTRRRDELQGLQFTGQRAAGQHKPARNVMPGNAQG
jgi:hypothetical protein